MLDNEAPEGWTKDEALEAVAEALGGAVYCHGSLKASWEEYTNPNNDFTVPRRVTLAGLEKTAVQLRLMYPVRFPNMSRVSHWEPSRYFKNIRLEKGQSHTEALPDQLVKSGWNVGYKCL